MKAGRLIEALKEVPSDTEINCEIIDNPMISDLFEVIPEYEIESVLIAPKDCTLLIKEKPEKCEENNPYQYNPKGVRN